MFDIFGSPDHWTETGVATSTTAPIKVAPIKSIFCIVVLLNKGTRLISNHSANQLFELSRCMHLLICGCCLSKIEQPAPRPLPSSIRRRKSLQPLCSRCRSRTAVSPDSGDAGAWTNIRPYRPGFAVLELGEEGANYEDLLGRLKRVATNVLRARGETVTDIEITTVESGEAAMALWVIQARKTGVVGATLNSAL